MEQVIGILGEAFSLDHPDINVTYNPTGSGSGIQAVLNGRCDIGLSSRYLKDSEQEQGLVETVLAYDGIAVIVNLENPIADLSLEQLKSVYTGQITDWLELGGTPGQIVLIGREAGSGTRDGFESATDTAGLCSYRQELTSTGDVITTVASNPNAIGYASLASVKDSVQTISINGVTPSEETIRDGSYPVQRPFLLITSSEIPLSEASALFYQFATGSEGVDWITRAGVVAAFSGQ
jgi:phosphate transport system substrate-binding protein